MRASVVVTPGAKSFVIFGRACAPGAISPSCPFESGHVHQDISGEIMRVRCGGNTSGNQWVIRGAGGTDTVRVATAPANPTGPSGAW